MQWAWYVGDGVKDVPLESVVLVYGDVELGRGVALGARTPGHTDRLLAAIPPTVSLSRSLHNVTARNDPDDNADPSAQSPLFCGPFPCLFTDITRDYFGRMWRR